MLGYDGISRDTVHEGLGFSVSGYGGCDADTAESAMGPNARFADGRWLDRLWKAWQHGLCWIRSGMGEYMASFAEELAESDGIMLDVFCGYRGGLVPGVLQRDPDHRIIVNDTSTERLNQYGEFFRRRKIAPEVRLAAYDPLRPALRPASVRNLSSIWGFSNWMQSDSTLDTAYDVLEPGGRIYLIEGKTDLARFNTLPTEFQKRWRPVLAGLEESWRSKVESAGFEIEHYEEAGYRRLDPDEGGFPNEAAKYGCSVYTSCEIIRAGKPGS